LKVTFLGTGTSQGIPVIGCDCAVCQSTDHRDKRLRVSVLVETVDRTFVIDSGPDFRYQMLRAGVKDLDAILYTHEHKDHVAGLDDIRPFNYLRHKIIDIYATTRVEEALNVNLLIFLRIPSIMDYRKLNCILLMMNLLTLEKLLLVPNRGNAL
jgi:phosphoribosyl 1,2-cyclic phosphate phosphodiesterase